MALGLYGATACLALVLFVLVLDVMGFFSRKNYFDVDGRTVLLTGGSQGMGRGVARILAQKGANVVIVARTQPKLDEALKYITSHAKHPKKQRFLAISADVTIAEENSRILSETTAWNNGNLPDIVWANAGAAHPTLFVETPLETLRSQMDMNYWAAAYLAHATLKLWLAPVSSIKDGASRNADTKPRQFIMTSSVICFLGMAGYGPYAPAKSALRALADTLRSEVNLYNGFRRANPSAGLAADVSIHCIFPGTIKSPGLENEDRVKHAVTKMLEEDDIAQTEDEVAAASIKGLERGGYLITTQLLGHAMRAGMLGGSPRNNWLVDTLFSWIISIVWLFVGPDMEKKVMKYGKQHQISLPSA